MTPGDLRIGLVGCGRLAELGYLPALEAATGVVLAAVADPDPGRRSEVGERGGGVPIFPSAAALVGAGVADALVLASPAECHLSDAQLAAEAGLAVLVEKPPAPDGDGAAALAALGRAPHVGFNRRFSPGIGEVRAMASSLDDLFLGLRLDYRRQSWRPHAVDQDVVADLGPHLIDLARWLSGRGIVGVRAPEVGPERASIELDLDGGRAGLRMANDRSHREQVDLTSPASPGRPARRSARLRQGGLRNGVRRRLLARHEPHPLVASLVAQLEAFAGATRGGDPGRLATAGDGAAVMAVIDAVRASAAEAGRTVTVAASVGA